MSYSYLAEHINEVKKDIAAVCNRIGKSAEEITLLGVTKTYEADVMNASIEYGIQNVAENRVQEVIRKFDDVNKGVKWHLIGHLQTNKVKYIIDKVDLIHSVDSLKLAQEISTRAGRIGKTQDILIQVNVADETQKFGVSPEELKTLLKDISNLPHIRVCGLMNIAPFLDDPEMLRDDFKIMKQLFDGLEDYNFENVKSTYLSMGMSNDYEVALEEGSNMLRIGTKIYGKRI
ncbi:YggS family pyridoxal phosphate-dependent enzyme [Fusibacter bizertensis]|uniref:Pyridoxal phosphate homeostasis protein n=1 Tax=Fusibacter bizertensis TaxID=1488331 RepID=A0ABT6N8H0_9FIRM|nr:YggS family pyridoxal phosphate-dependent enzyme [Fusibacter bizertensis]MDH8676704.1 YggS family pyridoxal phosphate-dependent enzyme [Fusibacter bizertensis]